MKRISVVIPSYNRRQSLRRAIDSVLLQSEPVDELIVVDDGSEDGSREAIEPVAEKLQWIQQNNHGVSHARNQGIKAATGDWVALLDSDDEWLPEKIARIKAAIKQYPSITLFHSEEIWIRNGVRVNAMNKHQKSGGMIFQQCLPLCVISPSAVVFRRDHFLQLGGFDEDLPACEDYDLWLRWCWNKPVHFIDTPLIRKYGGHDDQLSQQFAAMDQFRIHALHKILQNPGLSNDDRAAARAQLIRKLEILLRGAEKHANKLLMQQFGPMLSAYQSQDVA